MFLNEERNQIGDLAFKAALDYIAQTPSLSVKIGSVLNATGNSTDARTFLDSSEYLYTKLNYTRAQHCKED